MCRVEERVYIRADGHRQTFEEPFVCHKSKHGKLCSNVKRRTTEYHPQPPPVARDNSTSPASFNPPTPTGTGSYLVQQRRPSIVERRPSTRDGPRPLKPEIIIEFGSRKGKSKKYPAITVNSYKRSSLGASSIGSNEAAIESPGSDASFTVRTGLPETPVLLTGSYQQPPNYTTRPAVPHHRHTSSASSFTTSSQPPSLYATSDADSPTGSRAPRYPPTIVHNPPSEFNASSPTQTRAIPIPTSSRPYRTNIAAPPDSTPRNNIGQDGLFPLDYSEFHSHSGSSHASSGRAAAPEITDRDADRARLRRLNAEAERKRQQEADRLEEQERALAEAQKRAQEEAKKVRFELDRVEAKAKEGQLAESEKRRAEERDELRRRKQKTLDDRDDRASREERREKTDRPKEDTARKDRQSKEAEVRPKREQRDSRPPTRDHNTKRHHSRRPSISRAEAQQRSLLLAEDEAQLAREREATEQREREERVALLRQQQSTTQYWDPRGGDRYPITNEGPGVGRRNSVSARRPSIPSAAPPPPMGLGRTNSQRRVSIIQPAPPSNLPSLNPPFAQNYSTRPPSSHHQNPAPPLFSPRSTEQTYVRPPSARHASYSQDNPFAQPPTRTSQENPFTPAPGVAPPMPPHDPWDGRNMREALPQTASQVRQPSNIGLEQPQTLKRRGEEVINRAAAEDRTRTHDRVRQATRNMGKVVGFEDDYVSTDEENEADKIAGYGPRLGLGPSKRDKRRN